MPERVFGLGVVSFCVRSDKILHPRRLLLARILSAVVLMQKTSSSVISLASLKLLESAFPSKHIFAIDRRLTDFRSEGWDLARLEVEENVFCLLFRSKSWLFEEIIFKLDWTCPIFVKEGSGYTLVNSREVQNIQVEEALLKVLKKSR